MSFSLPGEVEGAQISALAAGDIALLGGRVDKEVCKYGFDCYRTTQIGGAPMFGKTRGRFPHSCHCGLSAHCLLLPSLHLPPPRRSFACQPQTNISETCASWLPFPDQSQSGDSLRAPMTLAAHGVGGVSRLRLSHKLVPASPVSLKSVPGFT